MSDEARRRLLSLREEIERSAMNNPGWFEWLSKQSDAAHEAKLRSLPWLPQARFDRWRMLTMALADD